MSFWPASWVEVFAPRAPVLESVVRGSAIYLFVFLVFRVVLRREAGGLGISDLLVIILFAAAAHGSLSPPDAGVADGMIVILTLVSWDWFLSLLSYHHRRFFRLARPRPVRIIRDGRILEDVARRELLTRSEILEQLRLHGVRSTSEVEEAFMEPDGELSVIRRNGPGDRGADAEATDKPTRFPDLHR